MGFFKDYVKPTTHTVRHEAAENADQGRKGNRCAAPGCNKQRKPGKQFHGTCGRAACQGYVAGGW